KSRSSRAAWPAGGCGPHRCVWPERNRAARLRALLAATAVILLKFHIQLHLLVTCGAYRHEIDGFAIALLQSNALAFRFELLEKIRLFPRVLFHLFPAEKFVVARRNAAHIEPAIVICGSLLVEMKFVAVRIIRDEDDRDANSRQAVGISDRALNARATGTDTHFENGLRAANHVELIIGDFHSCVADPFQIAVLTLPRGGQPEETFR